ncbi:MAG: hypothetical protein ACRC13_06750 [Tannerellaceae bacterium]
MYKYINLATYKFNVVNTSTNEVDNDDCDCLTVTDGKNEYPVKRFSFQENEPMPEFVFCKVIFKEDGSISLFQNPVYYIRQKYRIDQMYPFEVIDVFIKGSKSYYVLLDAYQIKHRLFFYNTIQQHKIGDRIQCVVKRLTDLNGHLLLHSELYYNLSIQSGANRITLDVVGLETDTDDHPVFRLSSELCSDTFTVPAFDFQLFQPIPLKISCEIKSVDGATPTLLQCRRDVLHAYYSVNESYKFIVDSITQVGKSTMYILSDELGLKHRLIDKMKKLSFLCNEEVVMVVRDFSAHEGNLILSRYAYNEDNHIFISAEYLFVSLGIGHLHDACFKKLRLPDEETKCLLLQKTFLAHENQNNNWITIYLSFISMASIELIRLPELLTVSITINEWILSSGFLDSLPRFKREDTANKTQKEIYIIKAKQKALQLISDKEAVGFVRLLIDKIQEDYWLNSKETYLEILKFIFIVDENFIFKYASETTHLLSLLIEMYILDEKEIASLASIVGFQMKKRKTLVENLLITRNDASITTNEIAELAQVMAAFILMKKSNNRDLVMLYNLAPLCRFLAIVTGDNSLLTLGIKALTRKKLMCMDLFDWTDIYTANFDKMARNIDSALSKTSTNKCFLFRKNRFSDSIEICADRIYYCSKSINALDDKDYNSHVQIELFQQHIKVADNNTILPFGPIPFKSQLAFWNKLFFSNGADIQNRNVVKVTFKNVHFSKKDVAFFIIREGEYRGLPGVMSASQLLFKSEFGDTFAPGDEIYATIYGVDSVNGHIQLSLTNFQLALRLTLENTYTTKAVFNMLSNKNMLWVTQEGLQCSMTYNKKDGIPFFLGQTYDVKVINTHKNTQLPSIEVLGVSDTKLDIDHIFKEFAQNYISIKPSYNLKSHEQEYVRSKFVVKELIYLIDYRLRTEKSLIAKMNYLQLSKLFAHLISDRLQCVYAAKLKFLIFVHDLAFGNGSAVYNTLDNTLVIFPDLKILQSYKDVIDCLGKVRYNVKLIKISTNKQDTTLASLAELVLIYNTLDDKVNLNMHQQSIKEQIVNLIVASM